MAVQNPYLTGDILGDLNQAKKKREGVSAMPDPLGVQGMTRQALRTQQAPASPLRPIPRGIAQPAAQNSPAIAAAAQEPGLLDGVAGGAKVIAGGIAQPFAQGIDAARSGLARVAGGDPETLPGGRTKYADAAAATRQQGMTQIAGAGEAVSGDVRAALGVQPAQSIADPVVAVAAPAQQVGQQAVSANSPASGYVGTGIGAGAQGGEIAARKGADGVMEFTNEAATPGSVSKAGPLPSGGIGNIGNGIGTFSVGEDGDSKLAMERFERANAIRADMIASRPREIGDAGGRLTIVSDSSRTPSLDDRLRERSEASKAQTEALRAQTQQGIAAGSQQLLTGQLQQQKLQQDLTVGQFGLEGQQRAAEIQAQLADPNLDPSLRPQLEAAYYALNTPAKDRYMTVTGGTNELGGKDASRVFDRRTGQYVDVQGAQPSLDSDQNALAIKNDTSLSREQKVAALKKLGYN